MTARTGCCKGICRISMDSWDGNTLHTFESSSLLNGVTASAPTGSTVIKKTDVATGSIPGITGAITGATNASPIVITSSSHGLATGDQVVISGVGGNTIANKRWFITVLTSNTFSLTGSTGNGAYTSGGQWVAYDGTTLKTVDYPTAGFSSTTPIVDNQSNSLEVNTSFNWTQGVSTFSTTYYVYGQTFTNLVLYPTGQNYNYWMDIDFAVRYLNKTHDTNATPTTVTDYTYNVGDAFTNMQNVSLYLATQQGSNVLITPFSPTYREGITGFVWNSGGSYSASLKLGKWSRLGSSAISAVRSASWYSGDVTNGLVAGSQFFDLCYGAAPIYFGWATVLSGIQHTSGGTYRSDRAIDQKIRIDRLCLNWIEDPAPACPCFDVCFKGSFAGGTRTHGGASTTTQTSNPHLLTGLPLRYGIVDSATNTSLTVDDSSWINGSHRATFHSGGTSYPGTVGVVDSTHVIFGPDSSVSWNPPTTPVIPGTTYSSGATITMDSVPDTWNVASFTDWMFPHTGSPGTSKPFQSFIDGFNGSGYTSDPWCAFGNYSLGRVLFVQKATKRAVAFFDTGAIDEASGVEMWIVYVCGDFDQTGGALDRVDIRPGAISSSDRGAVSDWTDAASAITSAGGTIFSGDVTSDTFPATFTLTSIHCDGTTAPGGETGAGSCVGGAKYVSSNASGSWKWVFDSSDCSAGCVAPAVNAGFTSLYGNPTASGQHVRIECIPYINHSPKGVNKTISGSATDYTFAAADFTFSDPDDYPAANFKAVKVVQLPTLGTLTLDVVSGGTTTVTNVTLNQYITKADIDSSKFKYVVGPSHSGATGANSDTWKFRVQDDGGTAHDGIDTDTTARNFNFGVRLNHAPVGTDSTVSVAHNTTYTIQLADIGYTDPNDTPEDTFYKITFTALPSHGQLKNGASVLSLPFNNILFATSITSHALTYVPTTGYTGTDSCQFKVQDDGGTLNGGADTDTTARTMTFNVA